MLDSERNGWFEVAGDDPVNESDPSGLTVVSGLAAIAYVACPLTAGATCAVGLALSASSTALARLNSYRACLGGGGDCAGALVSLGLDIAVTGAGAAAGHAAEAGLDSIPNAYSADQYLLRQEQVIGGLSNAVSALSSAVVGWLVPQNEVAC